MKIGIIGSGALGTLFAGLLASVSDVTLLGHWPDQMAALRWDGLLLERPDGARRRVRFALAGVPTAPVDAVLVLVKSRQTVRAAGEARRWLRPAGIALTLQNGLGHADLLRAALGPNRVLQGVTVVGATVLAPGHTRQAGAPAVTVERPTVEAGTHLLAVLERAGFAVTEAGDIAAAVWGKVAINAAINPPTALLDADNGVLAASETGRSLLGAAAREVAAVAAAHDITLPFSDPAAEAVRVAHATAANHSSMRQDLNRGAPTEIDAICGAVAARGQARGIPTPLNRLYTHLVSTAEKEGRLAALAAEATDIEQRNYLQRFLSLREE